MSEKIVQLNEEVIKRKCYGYNTGPDGELVVNPDEATIVCWIFERYLSGDSLGKIAAGLETQGIPSPTGKPPKWSREALSKLISNEKYTGRVLPQKTIGAGGFQIKHDGIIDRYLYSDSHEVIISDKVFRAAQQVKTSACQTPRRCNHFEAYVLIGWPQNNEIYFFQMQPHQNFLIPSPNYGLFLLRAYSKIKASAV